MRIVIAIFGESSVGKTTVAKIVAQSLNAPVRHCGEIVKARASELGVTTMELPGMEHEKINGETRDHAFNSEETIVIEGRFLNRVLDGVPNCLLFELQCSEEERARRARTRKSAQSASELQNQKDADSGESFHAKKLGKAEHFTLSTDGLSQMQVAEEILKRIEVFYHDTA